MISPAALEQQLARAVAEIRECAGDNPDVVWLIEGIERHPDAICKVVARKNRGGVSVSQAAANARRNEWLRTLRASLWPALKSYAAATLIATKYRRYEVSRWPRERDFPVAPLGEPERTFWMILRDHAAGGAKMPDVRQLATILDLQEPFRRGRV